MCHICGKEIDTKKFSKHGSEFDKVIFKQQTKEKPLFGICRIRNLICTIDFIFPFLSEVSSHTSNENFLCHICGKVIEIDLQMLN